MGEGEGRARGLVGGEEGGGQGEGERGRGRGQLGGHLVKQLLDGREIVTAVLLQHLGQQTLKTKICKS